MLLAYMEVFCQASLELDQELRILSTGQPRPRVNVGLELCSEQLPTIWDSPLREIRKRAITILIFYKGDGSLPLGSPTTSERSRALIGGTD